MFTISSLPFLESGVYGCCTSDLPVESQAAVLAAGRATTGERAMTACSRCVASFLDVPDEPDRLVRRSPRRLDRPASENLLFRSLVRPGRPLCSRALQLGGRPGGERRAARSERGEQRRRAPGGALSDPDWRHPEQRRTDLVGAGEPLAYAGVFRPTAEDFGHRNGPPLIPSSAGKREDIADRWSRRTGDERRPALGPHGIAHAHPFGRVHAARQERAVASDMACGDSPAARRRFTSVALDPAAGLRWPQLIRIGREDSTGAREHRHSRRRPALGRGRPRWRSRSRSVCSAAPGREHAAGPQPCIQRRSRCHQGRGHHWPFRSPFRAHAVIVFTYDWRPVNTTVREFPHTFLNVMDHPGPSR